jgi:hypothetical protein
VSGHGTLPRGGDFWRVRQQSLNRGRPFIYAGADSYDMRDITIEQRSHWRGDDRAPKGEVLIDLERTNVVGYVAADERVQADVELLNVIRNLVGRTGAGNVHIRSLAHALDDWPNGLFNWSHEDERFVWMVSGQSVYEAIIDVLEHGAYEPNYRPRQFVQ